MLYNIFYIKDAKKMQLSLLKLFLIRYGIPCISLLIGMSGIILVLILFISNKYILMLIVFLITVISELYLLFLSFKYKPVLIAYYNSKVNIKITEKKIK